jgi:hypothetical protein
MNLNRLINMFMNVVMRKMLNFGINKGMGAVTKRSRNRETAEPERPMTEQEKRMAQDAKEAAKRARKAARISGRF